MRYMAKIIAYGNELLRREFCPSCNTEAFVFGGRLDCCGRDSDIEQEVVYIQASEPERKRKLPPIAWRRLIFERQGFRCLYCGQEFNSLVYYKKRAHRLRCCWDHKEAYVYSFNNRPENYAAACQFCNAWKSAKFFQSDEEVSAYVKEKWEKHGNARVSRVLNRYSLADQIDESRKTEPPPKQIIKAKPSDYIIRKRKERAGIVVQKQNLSRKRTGVPLKRRMGNKEERAVLNLSGIKSPHISAWRRRFEEQLKREAKQKVKG
jgi:hypothetical protein